MKNLQEQIQSKTGIFVGLNDTIEIVDENNQTVTEIIWNKTRVSGPFKLATKNQVTRIIKTTTTEDLNHTTEEGQRVYLFKNKAHNWEPKAKVGDFILQDVKNNDDIWACGPEFFKNGDWSPVQDTLETDDVHYQKTGKTALVLKLEPGTVVHTREQKEVSQEGDLLTFTDPNIGDFYLWARSTVETYVRIVNGG